MHYKYVYASEEHPRLYSKWHYHILEMGYSVLTQTFEVSNRTGQEMLDGREADGRIFLEPRRKGLLKAYLHVDKGDDDDVDNDDNDDLALGKASKSKT
jgi:hypothetical protein